MSHAPILEQKISPIASSGGYFMESLANRYSISNENLHRNSNNKKQPFYYLGKENYFNKRKHSDGDLMNNNYG